ncbi:hypothetical protein FIBSPDRAFT_136771 [Athelia psychrophila]|uniref:Fungal N-terminal domain-containing protein n=1 Tax=Athelia psychrophila TaxID=1759441 RepID=A0A166C4C4_9AGAM|nr:hypothetical protein FIBSPDRAFT_136771 [Fibularhizoctonia sp. CBS 109695]
MAGAASSWPNITTIEGTTDVIEEIGRIALDAAVLFYEYCDSSIRGKDSIAARIAKHSISNISSRVAECRKRCADLTVKLDRRVLNGISARLKGIQDAQTEVKIDKWIDAPDSSPNFNAARDKRQSGTGSWFINGSEFIRWMEQPDSVLWLNGDR